MKYLIALIYLPLFFFLACSHKIYETAYPALSDGKYDSEFPYKNCSAELQKVTQTVKKLSAIAYYKSYVFSEESQVTVADVQHKTYRRKANREIYFNNSVIGSAVVISYVGRQVALLTCAHIVDFEDTLYTFYSDENRQPTSSLQTVSFKERQSNFIADFPERGELEILAVDKKLDIALLGKVFVTDIRFPIPVFDYPFGSAKNLEWGSFVYLAGYPKGYLMVTKGIVSQPNRDGQGSFLVDALFNRGFSGGVVLAIRDGVPNFEMVGIAGSVSADFEYLLTPPEDITHGGYDSRIPYQGESFIRFKRNINYGITFIIPMEIIQDFIKKNKDVLESKGYYLSALFR